jgi:hypothetical protein
MMKLLNRITLIALFTVYFLNAISQNANLSFAASSVTTFTVEPIGLNEIVHYTENKENLLGKGNVLTTCVGLTSGGTVAANQENCVAFTPNTFTNSVSASGGSGGTIVYQWQKLVSCGSFTNISGATSATFSSGTLYKTTIFRRVAWRNCAGGTGSVPVYSNEVKVLIVYPGTIAGDESGNCNFNSSTITGSNESTNNNYCLSDNTPQNQTYQWQKSIDGGNTWSNISGANSQNYSPGSITQTTKFRRATTVSGYTSYSNNVTKTVNIAPITLSAETFPNSFNTGFTAPINTTFTESTGTWSAYSSTSRSTIVAHSAYYQSAPYALKLVNYSTSGYGATSSKATSPTVNLSSGNNVEMTFKLYTYCVSASNTCYTLKLEFSSDNGSTWNTIGSETAQGIYNSYGQGNWNTVTVPIPGNYYNSNFKYRFATDQAAGCAYNTYLYIDDICIKSYPTCLPCPTNTNAGIDSTQCNNPNFNMSAQAAPQGSTGTWSVINGSANITDVNSPTTSVSVTGSPATLRWTITTPGCPDIFDDVVLTNTSNVTTLSHESFTNSFNTGFSAPINSTFTGAIGTWSAYSSTGRSTIVVNNAHVQSAPYALKIVNYNTNGYAATTSRATSPKVNLTGGNNVEMSFKLYTYSVSNDNTCFTFKVEISNDNGSTWTSALAQTSKQLQNTYGQGTWNTITIAIPNSYYNSNFRYRFIGSQQANCCFDTYLYIDDVKLNSYASCVPCPSSTDAGVDIDNCNDPNFTMSASAAPQGSTGTWTVVSGSATISSPNSPTTTVNVTSSPATLRWTITTPGCPAIFDEVLLTNNSSVVTLSTESFPNSFNTGFSAPINSTFTGSTGTWAAYSTTNRSTIVVNNANYQSAPYAIKIYNSSTSGYAASTARATSPTLNLTSGNNVEMTFRLLTHTVSSSNTCYSFNVEFSSDNGSTWNNVYTRTSQELYNIYGQGTWNTVTISVPNTYYNSNFKYRLSGAQKSGCNYNTYLYIDDISFKSITPCLPCPTEADAGIDITNCNNSAFTMDATPAPVGSTGTWTVVSGSATISAPNSPTTTVTLSGTTATLRWTITTPGCPTIYDDVVITNTSNVVTLSTESFPNSFNTGFGAPINTTFAGSTGTWGAYSSTSRSTVVVHSNNYQSSPYALKLVNYNTSGYAATTAKATSPKLNLTGGSNVEMSFRFLPHTVSGSNTCYTLKLEFSNDDGATWNLIGSATAQDIYNNLGQGNWSTVTYPVPNQYYNANFKYRFVTAQNTGCGYDTYIYVDDITFKSYPPCVPCPTNDDVDAGVDQGQCNDSTFTMSASTPPQGSTGTWTVISGSATIANPNSPTTTVTVTGAPVTLRWTLTTPGCPNVYDDVVLTLNNNVTIISNESFPNTFNVNFDAPINSTFTGSIGTWSASSTNTYSTVVVNNANYQSAPYGLRLVNHNNSGGYPASTSKATSPTINLTGSNNVELNFKLYTHTVHANNTCYTFNVEISNDNGSTWTNVYSKTSQYLYNTFGLNTWNTITIPVPNNFYNANFKYRVSGAQQSNCNYNAYLYLDDIKVQSNAPCLPCPTNNDVAAGANQEKCNNASFTMSASTPPQGSTGTWSVIVGAATISNPNSATTNVTVTTSPAVLKWTITTPGCQTPAFDTVRLTNTVTTSANAGSDQSQCGNTSFTMAANAVGVGEVGTWTVISGSATIANPNSPTTTVTVTTAPAVLRWTISKNGCSTYDEVTLNVTNGSSLLGDFVWWDINDNGIQDAGEPGIEGVTVKLYADLNSDNIPDSNIPLATTTTNASGEYMFNNLCSGKYIVSIVTPDGYEQGTTTGTSSDPNNGGEYDNNGVAIYNTNEIRTNNVNFSLNNPRVDFGLRGRLNLGNIVWIDQCNYGTKDPSEPGVNGATVYLYRDINADNLPDAAAIKTTTTSGTGVYSFTNLAPGKYIVGVVLPTGYAATQTTVNSSNPNSDTDNDNNGIRTSGGILYSNYITLTFGGEPNSGIDGDGTNGNLTLDFGIAKDTDGDKIADIIDIDDDNDGITDVNESGGYDPLGDCDNDCIPNYLDNTPGNGCPEWSDCNGDGINDFYDWDRDGIINSLDLDSDNDGIVDVQEARPAGNVFNNHSNGTITGSDTDGNGLLSSADNGSGFNNKHLNGLIPHDLDRDGKPNFLDLDSDGDGITDLTEALGIHSATGVVTGNDTDADGVRGENFGNNGANVADNINGFGAKGVTLLDSDNDGRPNAYDIDSDNDGITDNTEAQATCSFKMPLNTDCDNDGVDDAYDIGNCSSCTRTSNGLTPFDKDGDTTPDYLDLDTDNDGAADIYEGHTVKTLNYWSGGLGDADKDGLMDYFDGYNIITATDGLYWRNTINNNMGNLGSWDTGSGATGSISQLPKSRPGDCNVGDRDWRDFYILPVTILDFKGNISTDAIAKLSWSVTSEININYYDVERSTNGTEFSKVAQVNALNLINTSAVSNYTANDNVANLNGIIYYRLKIVDNDGSIKYSNVINFKLNNSTKTAVSIYPNPAINNFTVKITSSKDETVQVKIFDMLGKVLLNQQTNIVVGINKISFNDISRLTSGTYTVQIMMNNQLFTEKLIVTK